MAGCVFALIASAQEPVMQEPVAQPPSALLPILQLKAVDVDNHTVILNKPKIITLVLGTGEDSQDAARKAGKAMYPFQGRLDFQLVVVVDLRDSLATWVPSVAIDQMRSNLDKEAVDLKPFFLRNNNKNNPRDSSHVIADFNGATCVQLGWKDSSDELRGILYGADGREIKRWDKIDDMDKLQADIKAAIEVLIAGKHAHPDTVPKTEGTKSIDQSASPVDPPLPPVALPANPDQVPSPGPRSD